MKIAAVVSTIEFQNRATIEAISKNYKNIEVFVKRNITDFFKPKTQSEFVKINYIYSIFPEKLRRFWLLSFIEYLVAHIFIRPEFKKFDVALLTNTHVAYLIPILKGKRIVSLFVDPYFLMNGGKTKEDEKTMALSSQILLCTSKLLASDYCRKYLGVDVEGIYWPNTVDISRWDLRNFKNNAIQSGDYVFGYAGNMNEITIDIPLVEALVASFPDTEFRFAGKINFSKKNDKEKFVKIFARENVTYLGMIPYTEIQREVSKWDVCLMLDKQYELSRYVHHNKVYQYLALGKVVVATKTHNDYDSLSEEIFESSGIDDFLSNARIALGLARDVNRVSKRVELAMLESSEERAKKFMEILDSKFQ
ncbi:hypothetical protein [Microbulbifer marinus]|uniref:Glycosyltransferase involved in cell wall bisynthesis n=1 Tax=Microbulbifer marinus TaxID=658218 RepID=A0A1H4ADU7_9GAMM|nr:hypothetical protein [Microbulbifer marinus]SEA34056.1 Glycosyltransferase involved in cell wall bisynthesis [Microbulbifer marinus]